MLEVKNLTKIYSGKGGVTVKALDDVSVAFPEKGMVFLLGKSGSGKSTLLNVAGGLDKPDGGEIIVKGKSSKDFSSSDFDSYRNTFIGFVFQEYNILNEFTIEQNIALALQLQSKPNDKKAVAALLEQVDLAGYGKRKPNTLSGGQKQRVAIARALIKEPEIIMADEPTGALDSNTGKQVLDTLKKLSETKLVIVVSHDREFAEHYGDRIIELKDGKIISDVSKVYNTPTRLGEEDLPEASVEGKVPEGTFEENVALVSENTIAIRDGESLTDEDVKKIGEMLRAQKGEVIITADQNDMPGVKRACKINENGNKESFKETGDVEIRQYDGSKTKFIKSRLPLGHAIKMGASGLKSKPFRLIFTILLAVAAFVLFGVASTFMLYDPNYSVSEAMRTTNYPAATIQKNYTCTIKSYSVDENGNKEFDYDYTNTLMTRFGASEVQERSKNGLSFAGIFNFTDNPYPESLSGYEIRLPGESTSEAGDYYFGGAIGFSDCGEAFMQTQGFTLIKGEYPTDAKSVALPAYLAEIFVSSKGSIQSVNDLVGKKVKISNNAVSEETFTVSGIYNVGTIDNKYAGLDESATSAAGRLNDKEKKELKADFEDYLINSFHRIIFVSSTFYDAYKKNISTSGGYYNLNIQAEWYKGFYYSDREIDWDPGNYLDSQYSVFTDKTLRIFGEKYFNFYNKNGEEITFNAQENGVYLTEQRYNDIYTSAKSVTLDNFYWPITNRVRYSPAAKEAYDDFRDREYSGKDNGYSARLAFLKEWQADIYEHMMIYRGAQHLVNSGEPQFTSGEFYNAYNAVNNYLYNENADVPTEAMWTLIKTTVNTNLSESRLYAALLEMLRWELNYSGQFSFTDEDAINTALWEETLTTQQFADVKAVINAFMEGKGMAPMTATKPFDFLESAMTYTVSDRMYYKDKFGESGYFPILGYYTLNGAEGWAEFLISSAVFDQHATNVPIEWGYRVGEVETSYTVPEDAKYNYLVSLTDNSKSQIAAILSTETDTEIYIRSTVYEELQVFLSLIKQLEKIFLYVGLGVGVLAAFFLLNFISVSISAKKKDIGILRAVGARGSDVFRIFYAEAFIIALICFVLASVVSFVVCFELNKTMVEAVSMKLLNFGPINIALVFGISFFVSVIATFFPVYMAARKSPVEAIRAL